MRRTTVITAVGVAAALALSGCSSSGGKDSGGGNKAKGACSLSNPPQAQAKAPSASGSSLKASGKVGVILPDTTSSARYTQFDAPLLKKALTDAGVTANIQNAQGQVSQYKTIAQQMIGSGIKVLIMDSIDPASGAAVEQLATRAGVKVIDYDRVNLGGSAQYYVSFDNEDVGKLQAQTLVDCLNDQGVEKPKIIMMNGGTDVDNNAVLFQKGAHSVFDPLVKDGKLTIAAEATVKGWDVNQAAPTFNQALKKAGDVDGVLAANDDIANAVVTVLQSKGGAGKVAVTGQDAGIAGLQNIVKGTQSMTIFKDVGKYEAPAAAQLAIALLAGKSPADAGLTLTDFPDPKAPGHKIQALLLPATVITQANVEDVVTAKAVKASAICQGLTSQCSKLGVK
jgi:D-xylose transport system substrate-binding protein